METLDSPAKLSYNNGNNFPPNFKMMAYIFLVISVPILMFGSYIFGAIVMLLAISTISNRNIVSIEVEQNVIHDYSLFLGFIKIGKKFPLDKYKYVTNMPFIESQRIYASTSNSTTISNSYYTVTFFGERLKGKRIITKYDSKIEAADIAAKLADRLELKFFEYNPILARQVLLGQKSI